MRVEGIEMWRTGGSVFINTRISLKDADSAEIAVNNALSSINAGKNVDMRFDVEREPRSKQANKMLWACLSDIALAIGTDKWSVYIECLKRYTKPVYVVIGESKLESFQRLYREIEVIEPTIYEGQNALLVACYIGSSQLSKLEFSKLLDGVLGEMNEIGLETPSDRKVREIIEAYVPEE